MSVVHSTKKAMQKKQSGTAKIGRIFWESRARRKKKEQEEEDEESRKFSFQTSINFRPKKKKTRCVVLLDIRTLLSAGENNYARTLLATTYYSWLS